jgi:LacI family transcriptional regulator
MSTSGTPPETSRVTSQDVARYAQVSAAVVSYVINNGPRKVAPQTQARVLEAIRVLGYRPNAAARALKLGSPEMIGIVVPDSTNPFFAEFSHAVEDAAGERGHALLLANSGETAAIERKHLKAFASRQVDGVLLASVSPFPDVSPLIAAGIPVVLLDRSTPFDDVTSIGVDLRAGARMAVEHLIGHGHTNIGLVIGAQQSAEQEREQGWLDALTEAGLPEGPIARGPFSRAGGYAAGQRLLKLAHRPTAIFVSSDIQAIGVLRALHESGLDIPAEMAIVSFDGSPESEYSWPSLTTLRQPVRSMAVDAVSSLFHKADSSHTTYPTELIIRRSCGCTP